jgi:16S rRNA A1518/A1519 N6-dimethyltransferase RsmA/KsgA/DIM1 with predicted DNA glycosylase/AP lyase activity
MDDLSSTGKALIYSGELTGRNLDQTGQHYMIDKKLIQFIVQSAELKPTDVVLEIGYGKGALTKELVKKCKVIAVDIELNELNFINGKLRVINGNILKLFEELYIKHKFNKIVSNIPYNISEPLMKILFKHIELECIVLTMGKNFSDLLLQKDNRIGIIANRLYTIEQLQLVSPKSFSPAPRVDSVVLRFIPKQTNSIYKKLVVFDGVKLKNALERIWKNKTKKQVKALTVNPLFSKRLYELSNEEFVEFDSLIGAM